VSNAYLTIKSIFYLPLQISLASTTLALKIKTKTPQSHKACLIPCKSSKWLFLTSRLTFGGTKRSLWDNFQPSVAQNFRNFHLIKWAALATNRKRRLTVVSQCLLKPGSCSNELLTLVRINLSFVFAGHSLGSGNLATFRAAWKTLFGLGHVPRFQRLSTGVWAAVSVS